MYSNNIMNNRNELVRRLLSGITMSELQNFVNMREEARPIPAPRRRRETRPIPTPRKSGSKCSDGSKTMKIIL